MKKLLSLKGAKETIKNYSEAKKSTNKAKDNVSKLVVSKAKQNYSKANNGKEMTPSLLRSEAAGVILSKPTKKYLEDKASLKKDYYKKFGL